MGVTSQIFFTKSNITQEEWKTFIMKISDHIGYLKKWKIIITNEQKHINYYLITNNKIPPTINSLSSFFLKSTKKINKPKENILHFTIPKIEESIIDKINHYEIKKKGILFYSELNFIKLLNNKIIGYGSYYLKRKRNIIKYSMPYVFTPNFLSINFDDNKRYFYKKVPKYLDSEKIIPFLTRKKEESILEVSTFPYLLKNYYCKLEDYDFDKHSIILGSSGSGKSKLISLIVEKIKENKELRKKYKIVIIDPHASIEKDIGGLGKVIDFTEEENSINLFDNNENSVSNTELLFELISSLMSNQMNSKLERILRHSIYLLLEIHSFSFTNFRKLLLDSEYRNQIILDYKENLPVTITDFFLTDFNDMRTKYYTESISPIISLLDEMELLPIFQNNLVKTNIEDMIKTNFLTIFSLNRLSLGDKISKTLAGLIMQQIFVLMQKKSIKEHIIFIIDEVPLIETSILPRFLSESRKYNLSLFLAAQYFNQISKRLQDSIFSNTINYYIFKVSRLDATLLVDNFNMKIPVDDTKDAKIKLLSELNPRECIVRISAKNTLIPAFKAKTEEVILFSRKEKINVVRRIKEDTKRDFKPITFSIETKVKLKDLLKENSTSRKVVYK